MSIVCEATIGANTRRIATEYRSDLDYPYYGEIVSLSNLNLSMSQLYGGYAKPSYGSIQILPTAFDVSVVPPMTIDLPIKLLKDSGSLVDLVNGTGILSSQNGLSRTILEYDIYGPAYPQTTKTGYTGTLVGYFTWACAAGQLNLTLDASKATDCNVDFTFSDTRNIIDVLNNLAYDCNHLFYIENGTLTLIDMVIDNNVITLTEFDFINAEYSGPSTPYALYKDGTNVLTGPYPSSRHTFKASYFFSKTDADMLAQLTRTQAILDKMQISLKLPVGNNSIKFGDKLTFTDESRFRSFDVTMWARSFAYTIDNEEEVMTITGEGSIA